jgi:hypothetical protein
VKLSNAGLWDGVEQVDKIDKETARGNRGGITGVSADQQTVNSISGQLRFHSQALDNPRIYT